MFSFFRQTPNKLTCTIKDCDASYYHVLNLYRHMKEIHPTYKIHELVFKTKAEVESWLNAENYYPHSLFRGVLDTQDRNKFYFQYFLCLRTKIRSDACPAQLLLRKEEDSHIIYYIKHNHQLVKKMMNTQGRIHPKQIVIDDVKSVNVITEILIKPNTNFNPLLVYKPQFLPLAAGPKCSIIDTDNSLFLIGIQTKNQYTFMSDNQINVIAIDVIYDSNRYRFPLINIIAVTNIGEGKPIAHFVSSKLNEHIFSYILDMVHKNIPQLDVIISSYNDVVADYLQKNDKIAHVYCLFQLEHDWWVKLLAVTNDETTVKQIYLFLVTFLLNETDPTEFSGLCGLFEENFKDDSKPFIAYFKYIYIKQYRLWSKQFRNFSNPYIDSNRYVKHFYSNLKYAYFKRSSNRLDDLLLSLLEMDKNYLRGTKSKQDYSKDINHEEGMKIPETCIKIINDRISGVLSQKIFKKYNKCPFGNKCLLKCIGCNDLCPHLYVCNCSSISPLCPHVHKLHSSYVNKKLNKPKPIKLSPHNYESTLNDVKVCLQAWMELISKKNKERLEMPNNLSDSDEGTSN